MYVDADAYAIGECYRMVTENMAEKMRFLVMVRSTLAYHRGLAKDSAKDSAGSNGAGGKFEDRRRLLLKGIGATLEQAERALETVGLVSVTVSLKLVTLFMSTRVTVSLKLVTLFMSTRFLASYHHQ